MTETLIYLIRPGNTALWLPLWLAEALGVKRGDTLTAEQYADARVRAHVRAHGGTVPDAPTLSPQSPSHD